MASDAPPAFRPTPTAEVDYLDEDKPLRGQNYVCMSFLSPEDVLASKDVFYAEKYLGDLPAQLAGLLDGLATSFPDKKEMIDGLREMNSHFLRGGQDLQDAFRVFKTLHGEALEKEFHEKNDFRTTMRGIKVRGVFDTLREAQVRAEVLKKMGDKFDIFVGQVGCWCPWSPNPHEMQDQQYAETQLNELMHQYQDNMTVRDQVFQDRKDAKVKSAADAVAEAAAAAAAAAAASGEASGSGSAAAGADAGADAVMTAADAWRPREGASAPEPAPAPEQ